MLKSDFKSTQDTFFESIVDNTRALDFILSDHAEERLDTYRRTIFENLRNALMITFPGVWKLLGEECANSAAYAFCQFRDHLPTSGCLDDWGDQFPLFLADQPAFQNLPYLKEYAQFEWLKQKAYSTEHVKPFLATELQTIPPDLMGSAQLILLPSVCLFSAVYPLNEIQEIIENPAAEAIKVTRNTSFGIIARPYHHVLTFWVSETVWEFLSQLEAGSCLENAVENCLKKFPQFDFSDAFSFLFEHQLVYQVVIQKRI